MDTEQVLETVQKTAEINEKIKKKTGLDEGAWFAPPNPPLTEMSEQDLELSVAIMTDPLELHLRGLLRELLCLSEEKLKKKLMEIGTELSLRKLSPDARLMMQSRMKKR